MYRNVYYDYKNRAVRLFTWDKQGNRVDYDVPFQPYLYIENSNSNDGVSIFNTKLVKRHFKTQFERKRFVDTSGIKRIFYNLSAEQQFLVDRFKDDNLKPEFKANDLRTFFIDIEVYSKFEFPTAKDANHPINLITVYDSMVGEYITWGLQNNFTNAHLREDLDYRMFHDEKSLLQNFVKYWSNNYPDVVTGWNSDAFDITYIVNRLRKLFSENYPDKLSPVGNIYSYEKLDRFKQPITVWSIGGISCMDYLKVYKKFSRNERESYKLDYIGEYELNEGKIPFDGNLADLADSDWTKFVEYNIQDVVLLVKLEQKLKYLRIARDLAYMGCAKIEKTLETNSVVAGAFAIEAHGRGQIIPTFEYGSGERYAGGFVRDPVPGFRSDVISYDASSLYPNIMITLNLSPETKIGKYEVIDDEHVMVYVHGGQAHKMTKVNLTKYMKANNVVRSANNVLFDQKIKGIIPTIIDRIYQSRKTIKGDGLTLEAKLKRGELSGVELENAQRIIDDADTMQYSLKIFINSIYGTFGNQYSALYDIDLASATTITGQESNIQAGLSANRFIKDEYGIDTDVIIYGDTDSIYITLEAVYKHLGISLQDEKGFITKEAMRVIEQLGGEKNPENGIITKDLMDWGINTLNSADCRFEFKREKICNSAIFLNGKKQYMLYALDNEGVPYLDENGTPKAKLSITGGELISSKHSKKIREMVIEVVKVIMDTKDPIISSTKFNEVYEAYKLLTPDELAVRQSIKTYKKYEHLANGLHLKKGIPPGSKGAYIYNGIVDKLGLGGKYQKIQDGDKIKRLYVAKNKFGIEYLAFLDNLPDEFGLEPNYKLLFDKNINPIMERIFTSVGWGHVTPTKQFSVNLLDMM